MLGTLVQLTSLTVLKHDVARQAIYLFTHTHGLHAAGYRHLISLFGSMSHDARQHPGLADETKSAGENSRSVGGPTRAERIFTRFCEPPRVPVASGVDGDYANFNQSALREMPTVPFSEGAATREMQQGGPCPAAAETMSAVLPPSG